jgi:hypothetical protein
MVSSKPLNPIVGQCYFDPFSHYTFIFTGKDWELLSSSPIATSLWTMVPTDEQLEQYPTLKQAWEEYLVIRKLLGI